MPAAAASAVAPAPHYFWRPWLELYDRRTRPIEVPFILNCLGADVLEIIAQHAGPRAFARLACACRAFAAFASRSESIWRAYCFEAFAHRESSKITARICVERYGGSYRTMWRSRLRLRSDGVYVSRNTYVKPGATTPTERAPVHLVCYYRYFRFIPGPAGAFMSKTSPKPVRVEGKTLKDSAAAAKDNSTSHGSYTIDGDDRVHCQVLRINAMASSMTSTHFFTRLRETKPGASNRLDVVKICLCDDEEGAPTPSEQEWRDIDCEEHIYRRALGISSDHAYDGSAAVRNSTRGLNTLVFVPWDEIRTHELNKGVDELDFYITG